LTVRRTEGFTLLEVLVALSVLALSMGAVIKATSDYTVSHSYLRDKTLSSWVARNVLVQYRITAEWPGVGERKGTLEMGSQEWAWTGKISQTDEDDLRRLDVEVRPMEAEDSEPLAVLSGFVQRPAQ
jgi:general secretion pathway protein I